MKTQMMQFRVTDDEKALIEKCAAKSGMTVSEYIRACMLMEMMIDGEIQAMKIIGRALGVKAMDALRRRLKATAGQEA
jgi:antitoxin component of RelBE/YafQ-DinJ toxin-antitoxin module